MIWAEEFCRIFQGKTIAGPIVRGDVTEGNMASWFANAMATALTLANEEAEEAEELDDDDDDPVPFDQDDEPEEEPTLEEKFKEGFDEGRV